MDKYIYNIKSEDLKYMKKIGSGTEGTVYLYKDDLLVKVYHKNNLFRATENNKDADIKIYHKENNQQSNYYKEHINYYSYNNEDIKLLPKDAIIKAIDRQKNIELTTLPFGALYIDNKFAGCVLKRQRGIQVHKLICLPLNMRKKIYLNILKENLELIKNNIYHRDLSNSPFIYKQVILNNEIISTTGHSHILVNPFTLSTSFIDLEGKSTAYTERQNFHYEEDNIRELIILALEFLLKIDYEDYKEDTLEMYSELEKLNISSEYQDKLVSQNMTLEDLERFTLTLTK
jgi:hypothetical protein